MKKSMSCTNTHTISLLVKKNEDEDLEPTIERMLSLKNTLFNARTEFSKAHESEPDLMKIYYSDMMIALASMRGQARDIYKRCHS